MILLARIIINTLHLLIRTPYKRITNIANKIILTYGWQGLAIMIAMIARIARKCKNHSIYLHFSKYIWELKWGGSWRSFVIELYNHSQTCFLCLLCFWICTWKWWACLSLPCRTRDLGSFCKWFFDGTNLNKRSTSLSLFSLLEKRHRSLIGVINLEDLIKIAFLKIGPWVVISKPLISTIDINTQGLANMEMT